MSGSAGRFRVEFETLRQQEKDLKALKGQLLDLEKRTEKFYQEVDLAKNTSTTEEQLVQAMKKLESEQAALRALKADYYAAVAKYDAKYETKIHQTV